MVWVSLLMLPQLTLLDQLPKLHLPVESKSASTISENAKSGIVLLATEATVEENKIIGNDEYGVAMDLKSCGFKYGWGTFFGYVAGKQNIIPAVDEPDENKKGAVCPDELSFLMTTEGGELDWRK